MLSRIEQLERLYEEEDQRLEACYDNENDLYGAVICTIARIAAGCNCVKHDLRAILKQNALATGLVQGGQLLEKVKERVAMEDGDAPPPLA